MSVHRTRITQVKTQDELEKTVPSLPFTPSGHLYWKNPVFFGSTWGVSNSDLLYRDAFSQQTPLSAPNSPLISQVWFMWLGSLEGMRFAKLSNSLLHPSSWEWARHRALGDFRKFMEKGGSHDLLGVQKCQYPYTCSIIPLPMDMLKLPHTHNGFQHVLHQHKVIF